MESAVPKSNAGTRSKKVRAGSLRSLSHPEYYFNRELSWLDFNLRVLHEALDPGVPLLERVKFLSIFSRNLDEFFMIRVSGLQEQLNRGVLTSPPDGLTPSQQLIAIRERLTPMLEAVSALWREGLLPGLFRQGIRILSYADLQKDQTVALRRHFEREIFPILTPLALDPGHPFPHISNLSVNLAVILSDPGHGRRFARLKVPHMLSRLIRVPLQAGEPVGGTLGIEDASSADFVWIDEVVAANLDLLFPGLEILGAYPFRVTRNADFEIEEDEASDLLEATREMVGLRDFGFAVRLEVNPDLPPDFLHLLTTNLHLAPYQVYPTDVPVGLADLAQLTSLDRPDLKDRPFQPRIPAFLSNSDEIFSAIRSRDILLYHPYDSFAPVAGFLRHAAHDPNVLAIKQTLYRVGPNSPIVRTLMEARENGKQVSAVVELKARFDEVNNIEWAHELEQVGVHVVYGLIGLKVHAKMCLVVRKEREDIVRYVHLGTGNYNAVTAGTYADLGFLSADPELAADVSDLFNALTGYSRRNTYRKLLVAPNFLREAILWRIHREIERHQAEGGGHLAFKLNALVDRDCIRALYEASQAGVRIDLQVRGICCLRPGVPGVSENISVTSVVGRFLEHSRIFYFRNGGDEEILIGSADLMPRNLDRRVEVLFPIENRRLRQILRDEILFLHLLDNVKCWELHSDGTYVRRIPGPGRPPISSQEALLEKPGSWHQDG